MLPGAQLANPALLLRAESMPCVKTHLAGIFSLGKVLVHVSDRLLPSVGAISLGFGAAVRDA